MLCDSNILIYAADPSDTCCMAYVERPDAAISTVCRIEVLGFPGFSLLTAEQQERLHELVGSMIELPLEEPVVERAIELRRQRRMTLADAIIGATALVHGVPLVSRNVADFRHIPELQLINPFETP